MNKYYCCHLASRFVAVLALVILGTVSSLATPLSEGEALQRAIAFMQQRGKAIDLPSSVRRATAMTESATGSTPDAYYVFNLQDEGGFVVVSGDDRTPAILGYADSGSFNADDIPDGLRYLLGQYADEMAWLDAHPEYAEQDAAASRAAAARMPVAPLLQSRWNQGTPYNNLCPVVDGERTVTGCVATAMAQVMYFHQHPVQVGGIPGYSTTTKDHNKADYQLTLGALDATTFSWDDMTTTYTSSSTGDPADAVAKLMQYCGWSLRMIYGLTANGGSSSYNVSVGEMLKAYFDYDADFVQRQHYTYQQWVDLMYGEVADGRPVVFGGQSVGGGHSFVCDGYDSGDYFHFNWGWGGDSDGYYRLSLLNPLEQGIGGSSTLDGFSYSQNAVIGIVPRATGIDTPPKRISLEALQFDSNGSIATKSFSRSNETDAFTGIALYYMVASYLFDNNTFDVAVQLVNSDGSLKDVLYQSSIAMDFNTDYIIEATDLSTPTGLDDGKYYINVVSRINGATDWQECYDGEQLQIEAEIRDNTMTLNTPFVSGSETLLECLSITVDEANAKVGYDLEVIATIKGGSTDYHDNIFLYVDGKRKMGKMVDIPAGQPVKVRFVYTPSETGSDKITVRKKTGTITGGSKTITISQSDATTAIDLGFSAQITNKTNGKLYGNAFRATVTVTNPSRDFSYVGRLNCSVREWTKTENGDGSYSISGPTRYLGVTSYPLVVAKNGTTTVDVAGDGLIPGKLYSVRLTYLRKDKDNKVGDALLLGEDSGVGSLEVAEDGYTLGDANGIITPCDGTNGINAGNACYADLRNISSFDGITITPSSNPNCLYLLAENAEVPSGLSSKNVVIGSSAATIALVDDDEYPFYSPIAFTAGEISYTRNFERAAGGNKGWNTIILPFAPSSIKVDGDDTEEKDWFRSDSDTNKHFWLRTFTGDASGHVYFGYPTAMEAYVPYLIAVPGDTWGETWKLTDKEMVFSGTNASIVATKDVGTPASGDYFMFCGSTAGATANEAIYMLNDAGSKFVKKPAGTAVAPFRGWFEAISISSLGLASLSIGSAATDINLPQIAPLAQQQQIYDLQGRSVRGHAKPGIYVMGGKKIVIK